MQDTLARDDRVFCIQTMNDLIDSWRCLLPLRGSNQTCGNETFKILKFRNAIVVQNLYKFSTRFQKNIFIITPPPDNTLIYKSSVIWNNVKSIF